MRLKLLKLFFLIASIIAFLETSALAQATQTFETVIRPLSSGLTNSEGGTIVRDAFQKPTGLAFSNDGKKVFSSNQEVDGTHECISMMTLSTPYDLRTASLVVDEAGPLESKVGLTDDTANTRCTDIKFSKDGLKMFIGNVTGKIHGFDLATPFDLSGLTYSDNVTGDLGGPATFSFSNDGKKLIYLDGTEEGQHIDEYSLSTAYDLTDITLVNTVTLTTTANLDDEDVGRAVEFSQDGMTMFVLIMDDSAQNTANKDAIFQFSLTTSFTTSTATLAGSMTPSGIFNTAAYGMAFSPTGNKLYIVNRVGSLDSNYYVGGGSVDVVTQIGLSCDYGLVACVSDSKSSLGTQVQLAKNNISINTSIIFKRFEVTSFGSISAKKPKFPKFIPKTGIPLDPYFLEQLSIVPSPPIAIIRSAFAITLLVEEIVKCLDFSFDRCSSISTLIPLLNKTSIHCLAITSTLSFCEVAESATTENLGSTKLYHFLTQ